MRLPNSITEIHSFNGLLSKRNPVLPLFFENLKSNEPKPVKYDSNPGKR